jgi:hypothetical protein
MTKPLDPGFVFYDQVILSGPLAGWMEYCGNFEVSPDFKTLNFPLYGPYPHGALFTPYE